MSGDFLREETSVNTESSKGEVTDIAQEPYLCLSCIFGHVLDLSEPQDVMGITPTCWILWRIKLHT